MPEHRPGMPGQESGGPTRPPDAPDAPDAPDGPEADVPDGREDPHDVAEPTEAVLFPFAPGAGPDAGGPPHRTARTVPASLRAFLQADGD